MATRTKSATERATARGRIAKKKVKRSTTSKEAKNDRKKPVPATIALVANPRGGRMLPVRGRLELSRDAFAPLVAASPRKLAAIESGEAPSESVRRGLTQLNRVVDALCEVIDPAFIGNWMLTPKDAFNGLKPVEVIHRGEIDRLWQMIYLMRSGQPG